MNSNPDLPDALPDEAHQSFISSLIAAQEEEMFRLREEEAGNRRDSPAPAPRRTNGQSTAAETNRLLQHHNTLKPPR
jgi:hypothetical protein